MNRRQLLVGVVLIALGFVVTWIGLNISADFADLGDAASSRGDDGSVPAAVLIPVGLVVALGGVLTAVDGWGRQRPKP